MKCLICEKVLNSKNKFANHLRYTHDITVQSYYNKFLKKEEDGYCKICGKNTTFINIQRGYRTYCSTKCANLDNDIKEKIKTTNNKKYGTDYGFQSEFVKSKIKESNLKKYGVTSYLQTDKMKNILWNEKTREKRKQTNLNKYGTEYASQNSLVKQKMRDTYLKNNNFSTPFELQEVQEKKEETILNNYSGNTYSEALSNMYYSSNDKRINTNLNRYGKKYGLQNTKIREKIKQTNLEKYNVEYPIQNEEIKSKTINSVRLKYKCDWYVSSEENKHRLAQADVKEKRNRTKRENHTFNTSSQEDYVYTLLIHKYGENQIIRNYKSKEYPFLCDFYIKPLDLFIECNFHWTHGEHWFDENSLDDIKKLELWKSKNTKYYDNAINTWTVRDLTKKKYLDKLNSLVFWSLDEFKNWIMEVRDGSK